MKANFLFTHLLPPFNACAPSFSHLMRQQSEKGRKYNPIAISTKHTYTHAADCNHNLIPHFSWLFTNDNQREVNAMV